MTSPATNPGTVASGAAPLLDYRCNSCGRTFSGDAPFIRFGHHRAHPFRPALCTGVVVSDVIRDDRAGVTLELFRDDRAGVTLELFRDDRAGVTQPTALQPVGGDQLEPGRVGQVEGEAGADVVEQERSRP